jgi:hypothetical protein
MLIAVEAHEQFEETVKANRRPITWFAHSDSNDRKTVGRWKGALVGKIMTTRGKVAALRPAASTDTATEDCGASYGDFFRRQEHY